MQKAAYLAAERAKSRPGGIRHLAANTLRDLLESEALSRFRPQLGSVLWLLQEVPELGWVLLLVPAVGIGALLMDRITRSKQVGLWTTWQTEIATGLHAGGPAHTFQAVKVAVYTCVCAAQACDECL